MLFATAGFAVVNVLVKFLKDIPTHEIVFFRSLITFIITAFFLKIHTLPFLGNNKLWWLIRGLAGFTALSLFFYTIKQMPLATATTIQYLSQIFTVIIAMFIINEKVPYYRWVFFIIAFTGVLLIQGFDSRVKPCDLFVGLTSAFFAGLAYNAIIKCKYSDHPLTVVMAFPMVALPITGIWSIYDWVMPDINELCLLLSAGVFTQVAQYYMTKALQHERAQIVTPFKYLGSVYAIISGYLIFDEQLNLIILSGILLIITGITLNSLVK
jgi:drug/metabolite transporter (DMT)-like permease